MQYYVTYATSSKNMQNMLDLFYQKDTKYGVVCVLCFSLNVCSNLIHVRCKLE